MKCHVRLVLETPQHGAQAASIRRYARPRQARTLLAVETTGVCRRSQSWFSARIMNPFCHPWSVNRAVLSIYAFHHGRQGGATVPHTLSFHVIRIERGLDGSLDLFSVFCSLDLFSASLAPFRSWLMDFVLFLFPSFPYFSMLFIVLATGPSKFRKATYPDRTLVWQWGRQRVIMRKISRESKHDDEWR